MIRRHFQRTIKRLRERKVLFALGATILTVSAVLFVYAIVWSSWTRQRFDRWSLEYKRNLSADRQHLASEGAALSAAQAEAEEERLDAMSKQSSARSPKERAEADHDAALCEDRIRKLKADQEELSRRNLALTRREEEISDEQSLMEGELQERSQFMQLAGLVGILPGIALLLFGYLRPSSEGITAQVLEGATVRDFETNPVDAHESSVAVLASPTDQIITITKSREGEGSRELQISSLFATVQERLSVELQNLGRRSNINLIVGVLITVTATGVLVYMVTRPHPDFTSTASVLSYYIPRVTTIALIETFAYFFLGLYKSNLAEIKYYQNERTTITALEIA